MISQAKVMYPHIQTYEHTKRSKNEQFSTQQNKATNKYDTNSKAIHKHNNSFHKSKTPLTPTWNQKHL